MGCTGGQGDGRVEAIDWSVHKKHCCPLIIQSDWSDLRIYPSLTLPRLLVIMR